MKKLPLAMTVLGLGATATMAEIKITDNLSTAGFVDMSASGAAVADVDPTLGAQLDQYELDFMYKFGFFSARADVNAIGPTGGAVIEQAFINAALTDKVSLGFGKFLSSSGFEAAEPTGLYQYSTSKTLVYGGYQNGVNFSMTSPMFGIYAAVVTDLWNGAETELLNTPGFEAQFSLTPAEGITVKATQLWQMYDDTSAAEDPGQGLTNVWAQYAKGAITAAVEFNLLESWAGGAENDESGMGWLAMANYKFTDKFAGTLRYSGLQIGDGDPDTEITVSPSVAISANLLALAEVKYQIDAEITNYAVEALFSF